MGYKTKENDCAKYLSLGGNKEVKYLNVSC